MPTSPLNQPIVNQCVFDSKTQYDRIVPYIISGETLKAVYDCKGAGTRFVGVTDQRLVFYDEGILIKKKSMVSIPYYRVVGIACADDGITLQSTEITLLTVAGRFTFEFGSVDKAQWCYRYVMNQILNQVQPQLSG
jgi:hypothetical protein